MSSPVSHLGLQELLIDNRPRVPPQSCWRGRLVRAASFVTASGCAAGLVLADDRAIRAVSALGLGFSVQTVIDSLYGPKYISKVHGLMSMFMGAYAIQVATQIYENMGLDEEAEHVKMAIVFFIISMVGTHLAMYRKQAFEHHFLNRIENSSLNPLTSSSNEVFRDIFWRQNQSDFLKCIASGAAAAGLYFSEDPVISDLCRFFISFYPAALVGGRVAAKVDEKILEAKGDTGWTALKTAINTAALFSVAFFVPIVPPNAHFYFLGGVVGGVLEEPMARFIRARITRVPIEQLPELTQKIKSVGRRVMEAFIPLASAIGFGVWQVGWDLKERDSRIACGLYTGSFVLAHVSSLLKDRIWNKKERTAKTGKLSICDKVRDLCRVKITFDPRFLGMTIPTFFFVVTSAMKMNNRALEEESEARRCAIFVGYTALGTGAALEFNRLSENGIWNSLPTVALLTAARTMEYFIKGDL